jgi:hypothetical protein
MLRALGLTSLVAALVLLVAIPTAASAFDIDYSLTPSTTQAGGHPDVSVNVSRSGTADEDLRDMILDLPPGLIGNPEAVPVKCTDAQFNADACPAGSAVGSTTAVAEAIGLSLPPVDGTVYVLEPRPTDAGTLGIVLRPPLGISKMFVVNSITAHQLPDGDYALRNTVPNMPRQVFLLGLVPIDITLNSLTLNLNARTTNGKPFLTNPTSCKPAVSTIKAVSYLDQEATKDASYTPTNCDAVPFQPALDFKMSSSQINARTAPDATITLPAAEDPIHQSHVKDVFLKFPPGVTLDILQAFGVTMCSDANFVADNCPAFSDIGDVSVSVPPLPPDFTGDVYRVSPGPNDIYAFGVVLRGPRGLKTLIRGGSSISSGPTPDDGIVLRVNSQFVNLPQIPFTKFELKLTRQFFVNPATCGTRQAEATIVGHSGATANLTAPYKVTGCYARPKSATPFRVSLVPAYKACATAGANSTHGAPLSRPSCTPPVQESDYLTVGTPDANGALANSVGSARMDVLSNDVGLSLHLTDVRRRVDLSDYDGSLRASTSVRLIDQNNGTALDRPAAVRDFPFEFDVPCAVTADTSTGGDCAVATSADAVTPGIVVAGKRATWQLSTLQVFDGGADGAASTADNTVFARQGVFVP